MRTNRAARRLLGMPYTLSKRKSKVNIFIAETAGENAENIPPSLRSAHKVCVIKDDKKIPGFIIGLRLTIRAICVVNTLYLLHKTECDKKRG